MSKFLHRHSEGWQCARDTAFNRLVSDVQANKFKYRKIKPSNIESTDEILSEDKFKQYESMAIRDELTGLFNTNFFGERLTKELKRAKRYKRPFSLILISLDKFGGLQKLYGNLLTCQILQQEAQTLSSSIREVDLPFRVGIEQFAVILPETYSSKATIVGQRICDKTHSNSIDDGANSIVTTVSIGVASFPTHGREEKDLLSAALLSMQKAKKAGGNQVFAC